MGLRHGGNSLALTYADEVKHHTRWFANWQPGQPRLLGDYGTLKGNLFQHFGSLRNDFALDFPIRRDRQYDDVSFTSGGSVEVKLRPAVRGAAGVAAVKAGLDVTFNNEHAVFFHAAGCLYKSFGSLRGLERSVLRLWNQRKWNPDHVIVTGRMDAAASTIIVSGAGGASINLDATGQVPTVSLADIGLTLSVGGESRIGYKTITSHGLSPLLTLAVIRPKLPDILSWLPRSLGRILAAPFLKETPSERRGLLTVLLRLVERRGGTIEKAFGVVELGQPARLSVHVIDPERSLAFYRRELNLSMYPEKDGAYITQATFPCEIHVEWRKGRVRRPQMQMGIMNVVVSDIDKAADYCRTDGLSVGRIGREYWGSVFEITDPDGYPIRVFQPSRRGHATPTARLRGLGQERDI